MNQKFELDITKEHCPMTFVKTKLKLATMPVGSTLVIRLGPGEPLENLPKSVAEQGHRVLGLTQIDDFHFELEIEKGV